MRDIEQRVPNTTLEQPPSAFPSPFGGNTTTAFNSPFFTPSEPQLQQPPPQQLQPTVSSFSFSLPLQQQPSTVHPFQQNSSAFSSNQSSAFASKSVSPFSSPIQASVADNEAYSTTEVLSETELKAFQVEKFILGSIPTKPPPRALCNL